MPSKRRARRQSKGGSGGEKLIVKEEYAVVADGVEAKIVIAETPAEYVPLYILERPVLDVATKAILNAIREELIKLVEISTKEFVDPSALESVKIRFRNKAMELIEKYLPTLDNKEKEILAGNLIHEMLGLEDLEFLIADHKLEEIVVNSSKEPVWVYHKKYGWLKTNLVIGSEEKIYNYAAAIGRRVGRQITNLHPLMDAHLPTGDRVNATLFPISTHGNTLTIRKFSRSPWTIIHMIDTNTISKEIAALLWMAVQYEMNLIVAGGTASGKTSMLSTLMPFIPPNQRIISIEDTREINLPKFLHWVPFSSREANPEGKGAVSMLDLLVNALRMRPDRIVVGEIRRKEEAEVMFEAIRTGHSAYATFHGDRANEVYKRLINPPMSLPPSVLTALHLIMVQFRHRRLGVRRTLELVEIVPGDREIGLNTLYRWNPRTDAFDKINDSSRIRREIELHTGMSEREIEEDLRKKIAVLEWLTKHEIKTVNTIGKIMAEYYRDEETIVEMATKDQDPRELFDEDLLKELDGVRL